MAKTVEDAGADALSLINTLTGMAVDLVTKGPDLRMLLEDFQALPLNPLPLEWSGSVTGKSVYRL